MADFRSPGQVKSGRVNLQLQLALAFTGISAALLFVAIKSESKGFFTAKPISSRPRTYSRIWFRGEDSLAGAFREGTKLTIDYWSPGGSITDTLEVAMPGAVTEEQPWAIDTLSSRVAWIVGASVYCQMLPAQSAKLTIVALGADNALRAVGILSDGSIAVPFADSVVRRWDCATGRPRGESRIALDEPVEAVLEGDYLGVSSPGKRLLHLYRFQERGVWTRSAESPLPDPPYRLAIPAPGFMIAKTATGFQWNGKTRTTPGAVRSVLPGPNGPGPNGNVVITGNFDNVFMLPAEGEMYPIVDAPRNSLAAAAHGHLALTNESGTTLFQVLAQDRMSGRGQALSYISGLLLCAALVLGLAFVSEGAVLGILKSRRGILARRSGPEPITVEVKTRKLPRELVAACAAGDGVLWAGAGFSAQAGFPDRTAFVTSLLQTACVQSSVPGPRIAKLHALAAQGDAESAMESLVLEMSAHRKRLLGEFKEIFGRFAKGSEAHNVLSRIGFVSAVTTNYDSLLEHAGERWSGNVLNAESDFSVESARVPFLLKLYGDLTLPQTVLLTRSELRAALDHSKIAAVLGRVSAMRTILFAGCSVEGLLADLVMLDLPRKALKRHYLFTGVTGEEWKSAADELKMRFGVEVLECDPAAIEIELPEFLNELAREVEEVRSGRKPRTPELVNP